MTLMDSPPTGEGARSAPPAPASAPTRNRSPREPTRDPNQGHPAAVLFYQETGRRLSRDQARDVATGYRKGGADRPPVEDLELWREAVREVRRARADSVNVGWMLDLYHEPGRLRPREGTHAQDQRGGPPRRGGGRPIPGASGGELSDAQRERYLSQIDQWEREAAAENLSAARPRAAA